jgi:hypothetical protein
MMLWSSLEKERYSFILVFWFCIIVRNRLLRHLRNFKYFLFVLQVRITEGASLYSLCRSWLRNGAHEGIKPQRIDMMTCLPKPLPVDKTETSLPKDLVEEAICEEDKEVSCFSDFFLKW